MATSVQRTAPDMLDVLDHVLDKGIVIDAWVLVSVAGIDLITLEARVFVASTETYLKHADAVASHASLWQAADRPRKNTRVLDRPHGKGIVKK